MGKLPVKATARDKEAHITNQRGITPSGVVYFCRFVRVVGVRVFAELANRMLLQPLPTHIEVILKPLLLLVAHLAQRRPL